MHGRVATHRDESGISDEYQDYFPGQVLLALAVAHKAGIVPPDLDKLGRALEYYRHRYRYKRDFGQVSWLMQAGRRWWEATGNNAWRDLVFEIGDWILRFQLSKNGGFITAQQADGPGYTTALYLEGLSAAAQLALETRDTGAYLKYLDSCRGGFEFLRSLVFGPEHASVLPNGEYAVGGLRASLTASEVRTDFVQHSLAAALELFLLLESDQPTEQIHRPENVNEQS
jgi:hypothetical protein